ncbi:uncharacterized protein LOC111190119 [Astyanax mexicanus]|uniref:uncharacterized protein LOC111190119 n=1 Tax=Astyanax mexicanus TaxID=7994 RepID=UPI0020CABF3F|nr:uncharacterized protein LOC111190119 [Astyanax mexicanus]
MYKQANKLPLGAAVAWFHCGCGWRCSERPDNRPPACNNQASLQESGMEGQPSSSSIGNSTKNMVETMAQALVTALSRELSSNLNTSVTTPVRPPCLSANTTVPTTNTTTSLSSNESIASSTSRINQALKRQFPNMFNLKTEAKRGKGRFCSSSRTTSSKHIDLTVYVLPSPSSVTPKASKELELACAGLGKRVVSVPDNFSYKEVM